MKVVADTMLWVSFSVSHDGFRHRLIETAHRQRVRFFVSDYILHELQTTLLINFDRTPHFVALAKQAVQRRAKTVALPIPRSGWVIGDPDDDPIIHTCLVAKADYLVTADRQVLELGQIEDVRIIRENEFADLLGFR